MNTLDATDSALSDGAGSGSKTGGRELMYALGQMIFAVQGPALAELGWSVFPQERGERRRSSVVDGEALKWRQYQFAPADPATTRRWAMFAPGDNVAVIFGQGSGYTFGFDVDVTDPRLAWDIEKLAERMLGKTPFRRVGRQPKILLIYRQDDQNHIRNRSYRFSAIGDPNARSDDQIEILAQGKPATFYGLHHKTGQYFKWNGPQPYMHGPDAAPLVTAEQVDEFLVEVQKMRPFYRAASSLAVPTIEWSHDDVSDLRVPRIRDFGENWTHDEDGIVVDGREHYLYELAKRAVRLNQAAAMDESGHGVALLRGIVYDQFCTNAKRDGRWNDDYIKREASEKVDRFVRLMRDGDLAPIHLHKDASGNIVAPAERSMTPERAKIEGVDSLSFLPQSSLLSQSSKRSVPAVISNPVEAARLERALKPDRTEIASAVQKQMTAAEDAIWNDVYKKDDNYLPPIHVLGAPTGAGKTTLTIRYIAADPRTYQWDKAEPEDSPGPILFLLPTYANIEELRVRAQILNLDASLSDEELAREATDRGLIPESQIEARVADLRRDAMSARLRTMIYRGKKAAGCQMEEKLDLLMSAGIGSAGLCRAVVVDRDGEKEEKFCDYYSSCPAILQRKEINKCHVVFLPHAFFTLSVPEELRKVRAVVADERIFHLFVHTTTLSFETLMRPRKQPRLTKKERETGLSPEDLVFDRERAAEIAAEVLQQRRCPARALADYREDRSGTIVTGRELIKSALRVCGSAMTTGSTIHPDLPLDEIRSICTQPTGTEIREEHRFWTIIEERIELLDKDKVHLPLAEQTGLPYRCHAKGDREMRLQFLIEETENGMQRELVRLSWRSTPNWVDAPIVLLDASASHEIIAKVFDKRQVVTHAIDAPLNVRTVVAIDKTYSNSSIVSGRNRSWQERVYAGKLKENLRRVISNVSALYGYGRVVVGASVIVRRAINTDWVAPSNADWCHFGALRGLDFAKNHTAAISFGRMEVPVHTVDGIVAALSFDDDDPEDPFDRNGDGTGYDGMPLRLPMENQVLRMRGGHDAMVLVPTYPGVWAKIVQRQYREEELRQFVGRLRPVYREGEAPVWFAISKVVPDNVIVDELVNLDDLVKHKGNIIRTFDAVRMCGGVLHPELAASIGFEYKSPEAAETEMRNLGFGADTAGEDQRWTWGFTPVKLRGPDQRRTLAYVRTDIRHPGDRTIEAFRDILGWRVEDVDVEVGKPIRPRKAGSERDEDWVDAEIGLWGERLKREEQSLRRCAERAFMINGPENLLDLGAAQPTNPVFPISWESDVSECRVSITEASAVASTDAMWSKLAGDEDEIVTSPVLALSDDYTALGEGVWDADGVPDSLAS